MTAMASQVDQVAVTRISGIRAECLGFPQVIRDPSALVELAVLPNGANLQANAARPTRFRGQFLMVHGARDRIELGDKPPGSGTESAGGAEPPAQLTILAKVLLDDGISLNPRGGEDGDIADAMI